MLSNFTDWKQWHHQQIKWRQQARKISGEEQSFRGLGRYRFEIKGDMQALPKILPHNEKALFFWKIELKQLKAALKVSDNAQVNRVAEFWGSNFDLSLGPLELFLFIWHSNARNGDKISIRFGAGNAAI